jgi:hypothetical protein
MLAGDGLPEGGTNLVTLQAVSFVALRSSEVDLRIDRSEGEPIARILVSCCSTLLC